MRFGETETEEDLRFPSEQAVRDFVNDPDYRSLKELRLRITTNANAVLAPEFQ